MAEIVIIMNATFTLYALIFNLLTELAILNHIIVLVETIVTVTSLDSSCPSVDWLIYVGWSVSLSVIRWNGLIPKRR